MALADFDTLRSIVATPAQQLRQVKLTNGAGPLTRFVGQWINGYDNDPALPSTAAACDNTTLGAMTKCNGGAGRQLVLGGMVRLPIVSQVVGVEVPRRAVLIIDRLSHQGGLVGNIATLQTTNLPTAALTRYTSGAGVMAALEFHNAVGGGAHTFTVVYTNSASTGGQTTAVVSVANEFANNGGFFPIPLVGGDVGVKSVESVQLDSTTGAAGNLGVTLFKVLGFAIIPSDGVFDIMDNVMWNEEVLDDACLQVLTTGLTATNNVATYTLALSEC